MESYSWQPVLENFLDFLNVHISMYTLSYLKPKF